MYSSVQCTWIAVSPISLSGIKNKYSTVLYNFTLGWYMRDYEIWMRVELRRGGNMLFTFDGDFSAQLINFFLEDNWLGSTWKTIDWVLPERQLIGFYLDDNWLIFTWKPIDWFIPKDNWLNSTLKTFDWFLYGRKVMDFFLEDNLFVLYLEIIDKFLPGRQLIDFSSSDDFCVNQR